MVDGRKGVDLLNGMTIHGTVIVALDKYIDLMYYDRIPNSSSEEYRKFYEGEMKRAQIAKRLLEEGNIVFE